MPLLLILLVMLGGCGGGHTKSPLSPEEVTLLKNETKVYLLHHRTPEFKWQIHYSWLFFSGYKPHSLSEIEKELNISFSPLKDPTVTIKKNLLKTFSDNSDSRNIVTIIPLDAGDTLEKIEDKPANSKAIEINTIFWQLWPVTYPYYGPDLEKAWYQFQYYSLMRLIDLASGKVLHQHHCYYPWRGSRLENDHIAPSPWSRGEWALASWVPNLVDNNGEQLQKLNKNAINHCTQEFATILIGPRKIE